MSWAVEITYFRPAVRIKACLSPLGELCFFLLLIAIDCSGMNITVDMELHLGIPLRL